MNLEWGDGMERQQGVKTFENVAALSSHDAVVGWVNESVDAEKNQTASTERLQTKHEKF